MSPTVSIIMPCHNGAKTIADAIRSVQDQTFSDWELLVINDNSIDDSVDIINDFVKQDTRIILLQNKTPTGFPATPRNVGIQAARGRFIAFLDCDDVWLPDKLEKQLTVFDGTISICYSYYEKISQNGTRMNRIIRAPKETNYKSLLKTCVIGNLTGIYDTKIVGKIYQKEVHQEDYIMWLDILKKCDNAKCCEEVLALYRLSEHSVTSSKLNICTWQWNTYRKELRLNVIFSIYLYIHYVFNGIIKYLK